MEVHTNLRNGIDECRGGKSRNDGGEKQTGNVAQGYENESIYK